MSWLRRLRARRWRRQSWARCVCVDQESKPEMADSQHDWHPRLLAGRAALGPWLSGTEEGCVRQRAALTHSAWQRQGWGEAGARQPPADITYLL